MPVPLSLNYRGFSVSKIALDVGNYRKVKANFEVNLKYGCDINADDDKDFRIYFTINIKNSELSDFLLSVEAFGNFHVEGYHDDKVFDNYTQISAPSIVYPYIRAFISNLTLQAGLDPIQIPAVNFANMRRDITFVDQPSPKPVRKARANRSAEENSPDNP